MYCFVLICFVFHMLSIFSFSTPCYPTFAMRQAMNMYHVIETLSSTFYQRHTLYARRQYALFVAITMRTMLHSERYWQIQRQS